MPIIVTNDFPPGHGGIQRYMARLAEQLSARDLGVTVITRKAPGSRQYDRGAAYRTLRYGGTGKPNDLLRMTAGLYRSARAASGFVIASLWFPAGLAALLLPRPFRGRLVVLVHGAELRPSRKGLRRALMRYVLHSADVVVANSSYTRELIRQCGILRDVAVVHCGVDASPIEPQPATAPTILAVGRLVARKGFDRLLQALPAILEKVPSARCEIVGGGPQRDELGALVRQLGLLENVTFLGELSDEELRAAYSRAWCFALPVRNVDDNVEGFGIVYLEAAMASLPAIGGRHSGADDAIADGETGILVDGEKPPEIAAAIVSLLEDPVRAREMGRRGRDRALKSFSWSAATTALLETIAAPR